MIYTLKKDLGKWKIGDRFSDKDPYIQLIKDLGTLEILDEWFSHD